jgi:hypothetical protein
MTQLIPTYSFIKLFTPHIKLCNTEIYINYHIKKYNNKFTLNNMNINMSILHREDYNHSHKDNFTNSLFINTHLKLFYDNMRIDETVQINYSENHFLINYELKNNDLLIEKTEIPKFKVENNNYRLLLEHYKFLDKSHNNENYYNLFTDVQKKIEKHQES